MEAPRATLAALATAVVLALLSPMPAAAHQLPLGAASTASVTSPCPGASIAPSHVLTGEFGTEVERGYVLLPFDVPAGTTAVRVKYCHDQPEAPTNSQIKHVLDLGLYDARAAPGDLFAESEFRGWGGSSHPDVTVSPEGFSSEQEYVASPRGHVPGKTTRGFEPGPIPAGEWAVELGAAAIASQLEGDSDGKVAWRVEIELSSNPAFADEPYAPAAYDSSPARTNPGWYAGDFHVHAEHSSLGDATMTESFEYAFAPLPRDCGSPCPSSGAGLDFITLSDYVTDTGWGEIGRHQADHPGKLIVRSAEIITYRGHANNHASVRFADYRAGPIYEHLPNGDLVLKRAASSRLPHQIFDDVHAAGGFTQINHPTIFPSEVPGFDFLCRGCPWDYSDAETDYRKVDAVEIATGPAGLKENPQPGPNPFTPLAIQFWEHAIDANGLNSNKIAAVGSSDSHRAGCRRLSCDPVTQTPIGTATTVVRADELSERGVQRGVEAGHTYVKLFGNDGPDLRFEARPTGTSGSPAIMGDTVHASSVDFLARVIGAGPSAARPGDYQLHVLKDGAPLLSAPVVGDDFAFPFASVGPGRYRLQVQRGSAIEAVSSPIYVEPAFTGYPRPLAAAQLRLPLAIAYKPCSSPSRTHAPPLSSPSCSPPEQESLSLTVGSLDANGRLPLAVGSVAARVVGESPIDPSNGDQADVELRAGITDVRRRSDLADYTGELQATVVLRITDRRNSAAPAIEPFDDSATASDLPFSFVLTCASTPDAGIGSTCGAATTVDAVAPGAAAEGARANWEIGRVVVLDGGPDGDPSTPDNEVFARQGIFIP